MLCSSCLLGKSKFYHFYSIQGGRIYQFTRIHFRLQESHTNLPERFLNGLNCQFCGSFYSFFRMKICNNADAKCNSKFYLFFLHNYHYLEIKYVTKLSTLRDAMSLSAIMTGPVQQCATTSKCEWQIQSYTKQNIYKKRDKQNSFHKWDSRKSQNSHLYEKHRYFTVMFVKLYLQQDNIQREQQGYQG